MSVVVSPGQAALTAGWPPTAMAHVVYPKYDSPMTPTDPSHHGCLATQSTVS